MPDLRIDLHSHTTCSDGALTPQELMVRAQQMQIDVLAITDHDTVSGVAVAKAYAKEQQINIQLISGVELSTAWHGFDIHILGLGFNEHDETLLARLQEQLAQREQRAQKICEKLAKCGHQDIYSLAKEIAGDAQISRNHIAQALVQKQICSHPQQAFKSYLGKGKRAHVNPQWISIEQAVQWIHDAGGRAVIAHPSHYDMNTKWLRRLATDFSLAGGDGMEVTHPNMNEATKKLMQEIALEHNLMGSAGSDFHAPGRWTELGRRLSLPQNITPIWHDWEMG